MIERIEFSGSLIILCKSERYTSSNYLQASKKLEFTRGTNILKCDIDSGEWGASYLFSMYNNKFAKNKNYYDHPLTAMVNGVETPLEELTRCCCYLDVKEYPLFNSKKKTVRKLINAGLKNGIVNKSFNEICDIFELSQDRLDRAICFVGNERFRSMSAIGYAFGKQVFCFPWLSDMMYNYYANNIMSISNALECLGLMSIIPHGR